MTHAPASKYFICSQACTYRAPKTSIRYTEKCAAKIYYKSTQTYLYI